VDVTPPSRITFLRCAALLLACAGCFAAPAAAKADDFIQLNGDPPVTLSGSVSYGLLYLDGVVRLAGDTGITATDVFIGPDASLQTCFDVGTNGNNCVNGRSLGISASGGVTISPAIDLRGAIGPNRGGGTLTIRAARVSLGGAVETAGTASQSGAIVIESAGLVVTQTLHAPGANIILHGAGGIVVGGDVWSAGSDTAAGVEAGRETNGGGIELTSSGGDVNVLGAIASWGRDVASGALLGGRGGNVTVTGGEVRVSGGIDARPGRGVDNSAGPPGPVAVTARGSLVIAGPVDTSGDASTSANGSDGAPVTLTAVGGVSTGSLTAGGGASPLSGRNGSAITVSGAAVAVGAVSADASDATSDPANGNGGVGGAIIIKATSTVTTGALSARGGSGRGVGYGGAGGSVSVTGDRVTTGSVTTLGENLSAPGGAVALRAQSGLLVAGAIDTAGAAGANASVGGAGGPVLLLAAHGPLTLGGRLRTEGGSGASGGPQGARGGDGGAIEFVVSAIAASSGVLSGGGNGGNSGVGGPRGAGGNGGRVRVWAQQPSLILLQLVDSTGGSGDPNGIDGAQSENAAPTTFTISKTRTLAFIARAPDAEGYRLLASLAGAPATLVLTTKTSGAALPKVAPCVKADYWLSAFNSAVGWQSDPLGPVSLVAPPSDTQACEDAPQVTMLTQFLKKKLKALRKKKWKVPVRFLADGMGTAHVVLSRKKKILATVDKPLAATRRNVSVKLTIPKQLRKPGKFTVTVTGSAPLGKARSKSTLTLEVKK
jgi:hypothetical protein